MATRKDAASTAETAEAVRTPDASDIRIVDIRCGECGTTVDRVEYDAAAQIPAGVASLMGALGIDEATARGICEEHNPAGLRTQEENATVLADAIVAGDVEDRPAETYACPNGHTGSLEIAR